MPIDNEIVKAWVTATEFMNDFFSDVDTNSNEYLYYDTLGRISMELVNYRIKHGLSQTALAKILGVTQAMVSKYENGDYNISMKAAFELFEKLGMSLSCRDMSVLQLKSSCEWYVEQESER